MPRFAIFIHDPHIQKPYVGVARVVVEADDEAGARVVGLLVYTRVASRQFTDADVGLSARIAEDPAC